jgi:cephalosporin-C deacetylase-like acetyl esterase
MAATAELKSVESPDPTIECFDLTIPCPQTKAARGYYARPRDAKARRCPAILYLRAAGVAGHWCKASAQNAASLATEYGAIVVDINAHGMLNGQPPEYYQDLEQGELRHYPTQGADDRDKFYFVGMYVRLLAAIEFIAAQEPWDGAHLVTTGESQGGGQALAAAGLDGASRRWWPSCRPCATSPARSSGGSAAGPCRWDVTSRTSTLRR